jgi:hypothetical protein
MVRPLPQVTASDAIGPGTLKLVLLDASADLLAAAESILRQHIRRADLRSIGDRAFLIYSDADPAAIRDWLAPILPEGASVLVTEFERWSARGDAVDRRWLLRRGH